jgi:hypothetical protein
MKDEPFEIIAGGGGLSHDGGLQRAPIAMGEVTGLTSTLDLYAQELATLEASFKALSELNARQHHTVSVTIYFILALIIATNITLWVM